MLESSKVPALTRAIDILNLIARIGPCSAATIIDTLGIPKSTAYLLLNELRRQRFLSLDHQENFCLWTKLVELSGHALSKMDLRELARPRLTQLMDTTGLLCHLGIIDNGSAYYILKVESSATISVRSHEGKSLSLYRSGIGKCLLAWQPAAVQQSIIEGLVWEQMTPTTITHPQRLYEELARRAVRAGAMTTAKITPMSVVSLRRCLTPITSLPLRSRWSVPAYKSMKNTVIIWRARPLPAPGIFHVCWDGKVPLTYKPHNNGEHHDPTKN